MKEKLPKPIWKTGEENSVRGYMCLTAWECGLYAAHGGNLVYPSIGDLKAYHASWENCGVVEVNVSVTKVVQKGKWDDDMTMM